AVILSLALASSAWGDGQEGSEKKEAKDPLPQASQVKWDVRYFEDSPAFTLVKRRVKGDQGSWGVGDKGGLTPQIKLGYQAALDDENGVKLATIGIETDPFLLNMTKGEHNRFILNLPPEDKLKGVRKVVIKNGPY